LCSKIRQIFNSHNSYTNSVPNLTYFKKWIYLTLFVYIVKRDMKYRNLNSDIFFQNRNRFAKTLEDNALAILNGAGLHLKNIQNNFSSKQNTILFCISAISLSKVKCLLYTHCPNNMYQEVQFLRQNEDDFHFSWFCERLKARNCGIFQSEYFSPD